MNEFTDEETENFAPFDANEQDFYSAEINPDAPHWNALSAIALVFVSFFALALIPLIPVAVYALVNKIALVPENFANDSTAIIWSIAGIFPAHLLTIFGAWVLVTRYGQQPFLQSLGWNWNRGFNLWTCFIAAVILFVVGMTIIYYLNGGAQENSLEKILRSSRTAALLIAAVATLTAPLTEEIIYRGVLFAGLRKSLGAWGAIAIVTLIFAIIHVPQYLPNYGTILAICLLSLVLTLIRSWTGNLLPCVLIHTIFNGIQSVLIILQPYLPIDEAPPVESSPVFQIVSFLQ